MSIGSDSSHSGIDQSSDASSSSSTSVASASGAPVAPSIAMFRRCCSCCCSRCSCCSRAARRCSAHSCDVRRSPPAVRPRFCTCCTVTDVLRCALPHTAAAAVARRSSTLRLPSLLLALRAPLVDGKLQPGGGELTSTHLAGRRRGVQLPGAANGHPGPAICKAPPRACACLWAEPKNSP
eukprot:2840532-Prymnesium_polylepis.1